MKITRIVIVIAMMISLNGCALFHRSHEPMASLTPFPATIAVHEAWSTSAGGTEKHYVKLTPALCENRIYVSSYKGRLTAVDTATGRQIWSVNTKTHLTSGVDVNNGLVLVGSGKAEVLAHQQINGLKLWRTPISNEILAAPFAYDGIVLVKAADDHLFALDLRSGRYIWDYAEELPELILRGGSQPKAANNLAVVGFANGQIAVFDINNGQILWKRPIAEARGSSVVERMIDILSNIEIIGNTIYAATYQGSIVAMDLHTGRIYWQRNMSSYAGLAVCGNIIFITDSESHVWALDRQTGRVIWEQGNLYGRHLTGPAVVNGTVVVADKKGYVHWLSAADGHFLARVYVDSKGIIATPVARCNEVYIYSNSGRLIKYTL